MLLKPSVFSPLGELLRSPCVFSLFPLFFFPLLNFFPTTPTAHPASSLSGAYALLLQLPRHSTGRLTPLTRVLSEPFRRLPTDYAVTAKLRVSRYCSSLWSEPHLPFQIYFLVFLLIQPKRWSWRITGHLNTFLCVAPSNKNASQACIHKYTSSKETVQFCLPHLLKFHFCLF